MLTSCIPFRVGNWIDWQHSLPISPLNLLANAQILFPPNPIQTGRFIDSIDFNVPYTLPTLKIVGVRIYGGSTLRAVLTNPVGTMTVRSTHSPDTIEVDFDYPPDPLTVTTSSFVVLSVGVPLSGTVTSVNSTTYKLTLSSPLGAGTYTLRLNGSTSPVIQYNGQDLDGDPTGLPSGDNSPGTDFSLSIDVVGTPVPQPPQQPDYGSWLPNVFTLTDFPTCQTLSADNQSLAANAKQWNFDHKGDIPSATLVPELNNTVFLRAGKQWEMILPINLGTSIYTDIQVSFRNNGGTRGGCQATVPAISFTGYDYTGLVSLFITLKSAGNYIMGIRAIDEFGNSYLYEMTWKVVL